MSGAKSARPSSQHALPPAGENLNNAAAPAQQDEALTPYPRHHHGPRRRSLNTSSFVSVPAGTRSGAKYFSAQRFDYWGSVGHVVQVFDPLSTLSVLAPEGGCTNGAADHRAHVSETASKNECLVAINAGFFNTTSGRCYGNIVSDGRRSQFTDLFNANFGIRADGTLVAGYLTEEDASDTVNPFVQLVAGVIWLVRDGVNVVFHSRDVEFAGVEETGPLYQFVTIMSGRSAVGFDNSGAAYLIQVDGRTGQRGMDLYSFAELLIQMNVTNAINLDGGGSAETFIDGQVVSYPSDSCGNCTCPVGAAQCKAYCQLFHCERRVTTVLCVHAPRCNGGLGCGANGSCVDGVCVCSTGWAGANCTEPLCNGGAGCGDHGICMHGHCRCALGWGGPACSEEQCNAGVGCINGMCVNLTCRCWHGWAGPTCFAAVPSGSASPDSPSAAPESSRNLGLVLGFSLLALLVALVAVSLRRCRRPTHTLLPSEPDTPMGILSSRV